MQEVVKQLSERLVLMGHSVTVATSKHPSRTFSTLNGVIIKEFDISGNSVRGMHGNTESYQQYLLNSEFDIITNFAAQQWATDLMLPILREIKAKKVFVPTGFSALHLREYSEYFEKMKGWLKQYDVNVFLSNTYRDIEFARKFGIKNLVLIPNGASEIEFNRQEAMDIRKDLEIPADHFLILHVGSHTGVKGHSEAVKIFRRADLRNATFIIVGNVYSKRCYRNCKIREFFFPLNPFNHFKNKHFLVRSLTREQTVALYKTSDLFLFPSNIECSPIVFFECMASNTPFLTTDVGNADEIIQWSHAGELLPTTKDKRGESHATITQSARILENTYHDAGKRKVMANSGNKSWRKKFGWDTIAKQYSDLYATLLKR